MTMHAPPAADPLPCALEAEQELLGSVLVDPNALNDVHGLLEPRHFSEGLHAAIFQSMLDIVTAGRPITFTGLSTQLSAVRMPEGVTIGAYLSRLAGGASTWKHARDYAIQIIDAWARRELIGLASTVSDAARAPTIGALQTALEDLDAGVISLRNATSSGGESERSTLADGLADVIADAEAAAAGEARPIPSTGFRDLDNRIGGGYRPGRLYVIAGNPGAGKTVLLVASARRVSRVRDDRPQFGCEVYSLEIDKREFSARCAANDMAAGVAPIAYSDILRGKDLTPEQFNALREVKAKFSKFALTIDATPGLSIEQIEARAKRTKQRLEKVGKTLDVIFIDYLQIMGFGDRYKGRKVDEIGEATKGAKNMAKRLECAVVLLSQLSRANLSRDDKRPILSDLRDSGSIEQDADVVMGLHRPSYYDQRDPRMKFDAEFIEAATKRQNDLDVILLKNRLGPTSTVTLYCDVARSFVDNGEKKW
jgi:replicative DNA helicase